MNESVSLIPLRSADIVLGQPLRCSVYDWHGKLLLASGSIVESESQLEGLRENGFVHDSSWDTELKPVASLSTGPAKHASETAVPPAAPTVGKEVVMAMDDMRWIVGETLYLQQLDNSGIRYTVQLIGFVKNKTVFVTAPTLDGKFEFVRDGQTFVVRAFSGKKAYAFTAAAVKSVHTPHPYLHLSYPKLVRCTVVRQGARAQVKIIASASLGDPERSAAATLSDLSMGGTSGIIKQPLGKKGEAGRIKFKVNAADHEEILNLKMILRSVAPSDNGDGFKHGFEFVDVSIHDRLILSAFVHQTLVETD